MFEQIVETSTTPHVTVAECLGGLAVRGSEKKRIVLRLRGEAEDAALEGEGETFTLTARADCTIACPPGTTLTVRTVRGDLGIKGVEGTIAIETVHGDVSLRSVGPSALKQAYGDLTARGVAGDLQVQTLQGDARIRGVDGLLSIDRVGSDLKAEGLVGGLAAEQVGADARLGPPFSPGATYRLNVGSDLTVRLPADASLTLALRADGGVRCRVPDLALEEVAGEKRGVLGAGEASLEAKAGGRVALRSQAERVPPEDMPFDFTADLEDLGVTIETRIAEAMAELAARLEEGLSYIDSEALYQQVERTTERAVQEAERLTESARRRAEQAAERARMRAERAERRWQRASGQRRHRREPATDEERLHVLQMVEQGKVTPEQAADLLAALEGH